MFHQIHPENLPSDFDDVEFFKGEEMGAEVFTYEIYDPTTRTFDEHGPFASLEEAIEDAKKNKS